MNLYLRLLLLRARLGRRPRLTPWDTARTPFRVAPSDLDLLGHMNNGKYLSIMDLGRLDLMIRCGLWARMKEQGWYPVVAGQTITYRRSLNPGQRFELSTRILGFDERSAYIEQVFCVGETVHAKAVVRARFLSRAGGTVDIGDVIALAGDVPEGIVLPEWVHEWAEDTRIRSEDRRP